MPDIRVLAAILLSSAVVLIPSGLEAQSTAKLTVKTKTVGGVITIPYGSCTVEVEGEVPSGVHTNIVDVQFENESNGASAAPQDLTVWVGSAQSLDIDKNDAQETMYLTRAALAGSEITIRPRGQDVAICAVSVEDEEVEQLEVDDAFQLLAGVEFISADGFREQNAHVPAAARWEIPVRVTTNPKTSRPWYLEDVYSLLTTQAEYTRILGARTEFSCVGQTVPSAQKPDTIAGDQCAPNQVTADSTTVFRERENSFGYHAAGAWRITTNGRWEMNLGFADRDVFFGPAFKVGFQTDPGLGSPDFFSILLGGVSLTQVEITPDYYTERFQMQVLWGRSPNYSDERVTFADGTSDLRNLQSSSTERWQISAAFQPIQGYYLRGSAEFGHGVPDVARLAVVTRLDVQRLIQSLVGKKDPIDH
ncbi:MAG TPA: hypothetical protein VGC13_10725 [Longimicrobium sp.]|jgi:hypothetical protein|uniref:hypothetical protein n=1 Tax=Longimicrobium sp. TaxID=2029185 RepID=UPI002ED9B8FF